MQKRTIDLAYQLLGAVPQTEVKDLMTLLTYYNDRFSEADRIRAMTNGSNNPTNTTLEEEVKTAVAEANGGMRKASASYITTNTNVCRLCGK